MTSNEELKPCPFCGGEAEVVSMHYRDKDLTLWQVRCKTRPYDVDAGKECYTADSFISFDNKEQAIEAWNTRAERTCTNSYRGGCTVAFKCSSCGDSVFYPKKGSGKHVKLKYCHNCGAKVANDD